MSRAEWKLPGYVIEERLGAGATSDVWRARVAATREPVALKRLRLTSAEAVRAAGREAAVLTALDHPYLVRMHDLVRAGDTAVLVLDLADGGSLRQLIEKRGRLVPGEIITALSPIGAALAHANARGILHGDVSAANVLFTADGRPLLADLGVARLLGESAPARCTPAYIDPSVAAGNAPGPQSDVFMLGAVAVYALTGRPLWDGDEPTEVIKSAARARPDDIRERLVDVPPALATVLLSALELQPARRCTATEFALELRHSGEPVVVAIGAGRRQPATPVSGKAADERADRYRGVHRADGDGRAEPIHRGGRAARDAGADGADSPGRPPFDRPGEPWPPAELVGESAQFTRAVRAALRPTLPRRRQRLLGVLRLPVPRLAVPRLPVVRRNGPLPTMLLRRAWVVAGGAALSVAVAALAVVGLRHGAHPAATARSPTAVLATSHPATAEPTDRAARPLTPTAILGQLDSVRERAFGDNDPSILKQVYVAGPLLAQDVQTMARAVPPGCALVGLHTRYVNVKSAASSGGRVVISAVAMLSPATLICGGARTATSPGRGPTPLRIELVTTDGGYRISSQRVA
jgi:eukaryotic-like serine/threonine-protein kinase